MATLITEKLQEVGVSLAELKTRLQVALAAELGRVVADAVRDVVQAVLRQGADEVRPPPYPTTPAWTDPGDRWADDRDPWGSPDYPPRPAPDGLGTANAHAALALAAGAAVTQWWARRTGRVAAAAGLGLAVALLGSFGPAGRAALAVIAAAADLVSVPELLSTAAGRLGRR
jgi:hypothetical protein